MLSIFLAYCPQIEQIRIKVFCIITVGMLTMYLILRRDKMFYLQQKIVGWYKKLPWNLLKALLLWTSEENILYYARFVYFMMEYLDVMKTSTYFILFGNFLVSTSTTLYIVCVYKHKELLKVIFALLYR